MPSLIDKIENKEEKIGEKNGEKNKPAKKAVVTKIIPKDGAKDKSVSMRINSVTYSIFTDICKVQGLSNNSALNLIISEYVRNNKYLLKDYE